jgi:hypothetical protein
MRVPRESLPPTRHPLRVVLEGQGPERCKHLLEAELIGAVLRQHINDCDDCRSIALELYPNREIPVQNSNIVNF